MKIKASVLLNVLLATTLLSLILFSAITAKTGSSSEYDPWIDYNDDGRIDHKDLLQLAAVYGSSGDPTKTVEIKHSTFEAGGNLSIEPTWHESIQNEIRGYKEVTIWIYLHGPADRVTVEVIFYVQQGFTSIETFNVYEGTYEVNTFSVKGSYLEIRIYNNADLSAIVYWRLYVTT